MDQTSALPIRERQDGRDRPAILLVHGAAFTRRMWAPQIEHLSAEFRVIALDLPGHGSRAASPFTMSRAVDLVRQCIEGEANRRALLVGLSLGGVVALETAHHYPQAVAGLILSGASVDYRQPRLRLVGLATWLLLRYIYPERWLTRLQQRALPGMIGPELAQEQIEAGFYFRGAAPAYRELGRIHYLEDLATYPGPTLILNGEHDTINRRGEGAFVAAARNGRVQVIKGAGHAVNLERPHEFSEVVRTFAHDIGYRGRGDEATLSL